MGSRFLGLALLGVGLVAAGCGSDEAIGKTPSGTAGSAGSGSGGSAGTTDGGAGAPNLGTPRVDVLVDGAEIQGANGLFFDKTDRLYVASVNGARLFVLDRETGQTVETIGEAKGVMSPDDVTIASDGTVYFTNIVHGTVGSISPSGATRELANTGQGANSITLSNSGRLFVGLDFLGDGLFEIDPTGASMPRTVIAMPGWINAMDFGPDGFIYAPQWSQRKVVRIDPETGAMTTVASTFDSLAAAVKFDSKGRLYALEHLPANVVKLDAQTGARTVLATHPCTGDNLAFDSTDRLFFSCAEDGSVHEVTSNGTVRDIKQGGLVSPTGIVVQDRNGVDAVTVMGNNLNTYDGATGDELEHRSLGFYFREQSSKGAGGAIRIDGENLIVADWTPGNGVEVWNLQSGTVVEKYAADFAIDVIRFQGNLLVTQFFANNVAVLGPAAPTPLVEGIQTPTGLAARDDDLFVASLSTGEILQIIEDGQPLEQPRAVATEIAAPEGLAFLPSGHLAVVETGMGNVIAIDLGTGVKTTIARGISPAYALLPAAPAWGINGVAVGPSGNVYVTSPRDGKVHRISFE